MGIINNLFGKKKEVSKEQAIKIAINVIRNNIKLDKSRNKTKMDENAIKNFPTIVEEKGNYYFVYIGDRLIAKKEITQNDAIG